MTRRFSPWNLVDRGALLEGSLSLQQLPRLQETARDLNDSNYQLQGFRDAAGQARLKLSVTATISLACERCLEDMSLPLQCESELLVQTVVQAATRSGEHELTDDCDVLAIDPDDTVDALDLLQDEILLALPLVPMHESLQECGTEVSSVLQNEETESEAEEGNKPFADLASLLGKDD